MFPIGLTGECDVRNAERFGTHTILSTITRKLDDEGATDIRREGNRVSFSGRSLLHSFFNQYHRLAFIGGGVIEMREGTPPSLRYEARISKALLVLYGIVLSVFTIALLSGHQWGLLVVFACLVSLGLAVQYLLVSAKLSSFIDEIVPRAPDHHRACPHCGRPYDPSEYREDALEKRCSFCGELLD